MRLPDLYLNAGIDVLVWNYRGYGYSSGKPGFTNIKQDIETVFNFVTTSNRWNKIGVHGYSIGGFPACHIAGKHTVDLLIAERTFSSINNIILSMRCGKVLNLVYNFLLFASSANVENYINCKTYKILLGDPADTLISESASLKTGVSKFIIHQHFSRNSEVEIELENELWIKKIRKLTVVSGSSAGTYDNFSRRRSIDTSCRFIEKSMLDHVFIKSEKSNFIDALSGIVNEVTTRNTSTITQRYANNSQREYRMINATSQDQSEMVVDVDYYQHEKLSCGNCGAMEKIYSELTRIFSEFSSAGDSFSRILTIKGSRRQHIFIENFFSNLVVWGRDGQGSQKDALESITDFKGKLEKMFLSNELQLHKNIAVYGKLQILINLLAYFENFLTCSIKKDCNMNGNAHFHEMQTSTQVEDIDEFDKIRKGHFIVLQCGHNGILSEDEFQKLKDHIEQSGFNKRG